MRQEGKINMPTRQVQLGAAPITPARWEQIKGLFHATLEHEHALRPAFLASACADDGPLRHEVESLLASHEQAASFIETPASDVAAALLAEDQAKLVAGQMVGHFRIAEVLAEGGMGEVYLAEDTRLGRKIALKLLPPLFTINADRVRRFEQEARAASALNHPNILTIYEIGQSNSAHYIATEFVDGATLREHMANTRMTIGEVLDVAAQVATALSAAHDAGIVHRDIKPENVMLRRDRSVKVLDFGLAKLAPHHAVAVDPQAPAEPMVKTNPGVVMGTVGYMSPEQARGEEVDAQTDIWSLGVVLYEMVSGRVPFGGETPSHVIVSILENEPPLFGDAGVPVELERIVAKALRKERAARYQRADDLALDLKNLKEELKVEARLKRGLQPNASEKELAARSDGVELLGSVREPAARTGHVIPARSTASVEYLVGGIRRHNAFAGAALLVFLTGAIALTYFAINWNKANSGAPGGKSIAVLPLKPINTANRDELYEIGIADSLIHRLSSMKGIIVRPLSATRKYADIEQDPLAAGREQQVDYVVASNYQLADGKIRITAQLFNVASRQIEDTYKIETGAADVFAMQDAIAGEIGDKLQARFAATSGSSATKRGTNNEEAYRLYLQGIYLADNRSAADARKGLGLLEEAVRLDQNYAQAWARKAHAHRAVANFARSVNIHEEYQKSIESINKALALDANLADAHSALCENKMYYEWDFDGAERECKRAIELDPDSSLAHQIYARYLTGRGRQDEAIAEIKTAIDLEPTSRLNQQWYGNSLLYARRYPEAVAQFKRVIAMDENFALPYEFLSMTSALQGNQSEAFEWWLKLLALQKADEETVQSYKTAYQTSGWQGIMREKVRRFEAGNLVYFHGAAFNAAVGNKDQAFEYLEKSYQRREFWMSMLKVDPRIDSLRDDPRFNELVERVESK
jgi:serine/threonine-protein kinase